METALTDIVIAFYGQKWATAKIVNIGINLKMKTEGFAGLILQFQARKTTCHFSLSLWKPIGVEGSKVARIVNENRPL